MRDAARSSRNVGLGRRWTLRRQVGQRDPGRITLKQSSPDETLAAYGEVVWTWCPALFSGLLKRRKLLKMKALLAFCRSNERRAGTRPARLGPSFAACTLARHTRCLVVLRSRALCGLPVPLHDRRAFGRASCLKSKPGIFFILRCR